jgi:alkylation response protein AidB-like acyl-CoA dehydrogenase
VTAGEQSADVELAAQWAELQLDAADLLAELDPRTCEFSRFMGERYDRGLAWIGFAPEHGGRTFNPSLQPQLEALFLAAGATRAAGASAIGYAMAGPLLVSHGTSEQRARLLRASFTGELIWCQLFSEPGAGSDLASVSTRAVPDGERWRITGQKVWSSMAHKADYALLLANSASGGPKHHNLTYFILDMKAPGVDVRPLFQMTGSAEFNEVFLTDVEVSDANRIGEVNEGWSVARATLANERDTAGMGQTFEVSSLVDTAIDHYRQRVDTDGVAAAVSYRTDLVDIWIRERVLRQFQLTARAGLHQLGDGVGAALKLVTSEFVKDATNLSVTLMGLDGMLYPSGYLFDRPESTLEYEDEQRAFLRSRARSIGGGTSEIMRNLVAERSLGMPRS